MLPDDSIPRCILLIVLLLFSAFFSATETALSYANRIRIRRKAEEGNKGAARVVHIIDNFDKALTTLLIGNNICNTFASVVATSLAISIWGATLGTIVVTIALTIFVFFFSETIPKNIGKTNSDAIVIYLSLPVLLLIYILTPVSVLFMGIGNFVKKHILKKDDSPSFTEDEFQTIIDNIEEEGLIEHDESELIKSAIVFSDINAEQIMVPVSDMVAVELNENVKSVKEKLLLEKYSRIPVYSGTPEHIVGILHSKDFLQQMLSGKTVRLRSAITAPYFIHPDMKLDALFEGLGRSRTHIAIVADEGRRALGFVTMEDILEVLFGDIYDEDEAAPTEEASLKEAPSC